MAVNSCFFPVRTPRQGVPGWFWLAASLALVAIALAWPGPMLAKKHVLPAPAIQGPKKGGWFFGINTVAVKGGCNLFPELWEANRGSEQYFRREFGDPTFVPSPCSHVSGDKLAEVVEGFFERLQVLRGNGLKTAIQEAFDAAQAQFLAPPVP